MKIKKVDDKPMVIHTKQKAKLHTHEPKQAAIKGSIVYTVDRDPTKKKADNGKYRKSTVHQVQKEGMFSKYRKQMKQAGQSIKVKDSSLRNAGMVGGKVMTDQIEGGHEIQQSAMIMYEASKPVTGTASRGAELFKRQVINQQKRKIKKVEAGKKIAKKGVKGTAKKVAKESSKKVAKESAKTVAKETSKVVAKTATTAATTAAGTAVSPGVGTVIGIAAGEVVGEAVAYKMDKQDMTNNVRSRKIKFFLDKMKAQDEQTDSLVKLVKDIFVQKGMFVAKYVAKLVLPILLGLVLLVSVVAIPVVAIVGTIYNSPFAIFLPPLEDGDTVTTVASAYVADFNREVNELKSNHTGYDDGKIVYVGYEGEGNPSNYYDILAVYMVKYRLLILGEKEKIRRETEKKELYYLQQESIVDIHDDEFMELHMNLINEAKRIKNISQVQAEELLKNPLNVGALMVKSGYVDGMVAGATFHSRDVIMSALQFVGLSEDIVFSYNIMVSPNEEIGENGAIVLADCAINQSPDEVELADIAIRTAKEFNRIFYSEPKTAFMSCSTYGSSEGKEIEKIRRAIKLARDQEPEMIFDGEFQMDTAIIPEINLKKAPNSIIKGDANVMIFPDLNSGNLVYKTMQRFGNAESYGPIICGLCKPVNDLSRGCSVHDIIGVVSITALQCKNEE